MSDDGDLRSCFRELRERDVAATPALSSMLVSKRSGRRWSRLAFGTAAFALAAVAGMSALLATLPTAFEPASVALPPWPTETSSLLSTMSVAPWSSPTSVLGQPSFSHYRESR